jgi:hypothetical protein
MPKVMRGVCAVLQAVLGLCEAAGYELGRVRALWQVGCCASDEAAWAEAEAPLRRSLALLEAEQGPNHLDLACVCNGMQ